MFNFFRRDDGGINSGYWAEKCIAESVFGNGIREWSMKSFGESILECFKEWLVDNLSNIEVIREVKEDIRSHFAYCEDEWSCVEAMRSFNSDHIDFNDFFMDNSCMQKTFHFIWCCFAIVYGIQKYDEYKKEKQNV